MKYLCWVIFAHLGPFWLMKFIGLIWSLDLGSNICFGLCTFFYIYICTIFVFSWAHFVILLAEYEFMTCGAWNFMEENETQKAIEDIELVVSLFGYIFDFLLIFGFISISFCKYLFVYIYLLCTELDIEQIRNFVWIRRIIQ